MDVIKWFKNLTNKKSLTFLIFDIVDFYPSISQELLSKSLKWAKTFTSISDIEYRTIMHARRTLLYDNKNVPWIKREGIKQFDVSMGAYDGAEICELVGLYALNQINDKVKTTSIGLYRDDGLAAIRGTGRTADNTRKTLIQIFKDIGLNIMVQTNLKSQLP